MKRLRLALLVALLGAVPASAQPRAGRVDLDLKDADLHNLLRLFSQVGHVNIVVPEDVRGTVTVRMLDVPWEAAMRTILRSRGLGYVREDNMIRVAPLERLAKEAEEEDKLRALRGPQPITRRFTLQHAEGSALSEAVTARMTGRGRLFVDPRGNSLLVSDEPAAVARVEAYLRRVDQAGPVAPQPP